MKLLRMLPLVAAALVWTQAVTAADRPNVLFIAVDDLRPQLACYGRSQMHTPHIDRLARRGVLFERAYCMVPTCGASRASLMTGIRPASNRFVNYLAWAQRDAPGVTTLNTHFRNHGYTTISLGKVFHHLEDNAQGWSEAAWRPTGSDYQKRAEHDRAIAAHRKQYPNRNRYRGPAFEAADAPDDAYRDGQIAARACEYLEGFAARRRDASGGDAAPFFLAVGFYKPHLPFTAPQKYWDLYDADRIDLPANYHPPKDAPDGAVHNSGELRAYAGIPPRGPVDRPTARQLIHGYYACVSFADAQVGRLLDALDQLGLADNTLVVLWGDHGWQLGEHGMWNKHSCFETSMHAPLLVAAPGVDGVQPGTRVAALTEFIDIYPSLCQLAGLPAPDHLQGSSFVPLMRDPAAAGKPYAVGRYRAGDTIRSDRFRFSQYRDGQGRPTGRMLYDHALDPDENVNIAESPGQAAEAAELAGQLESRQGKPNPKPAARKTR